MVFIFSVVLSKVKQRKLILHTEKEQFSIDEITNWLFFDSYACSFESYFSHFSWNELIVELKLRKPIAETH